MGPEPQKPEILEVILAAKPGSVVPDPISGRNDLEERVSLSTVAGEVPKIIAGITNRLWSEMAEGEEHLSYHSIVDRPPLMVFISLQLHRELCRVAPQVFLDKNKLSEETNIERVNSWLRLKVDRMLQLRERKARQG